MNEEMLHNEVDFLLECNFRWYISTSQKLCNQFDDQFFNLCNFMWQFQLKEIFILRNCRISQQASFKVRNDIFKKIGSTFGFVSSNLDFFKFYVLLEHPVEFETSTLEIGLLWVISKSWVKRKSVRSGSMSGLYDKKLAMQPNCFWAWLLKEKVM